MIDKGLEDGVVVNSPVMTPVEIDQASGGVEGALVGKVTTVTEKTATVVLLTNEACNVEAKVEPRFDEIDPKDCRANIEARFCVEVMAEGYERVFRNVIG